MIPNYPVKSSGLFATREVLIEDVRIESTLILHLCTELVSVSAWIVWMESPIEPAVAIEAFGASDFKG
jgi:hypothetical protein